MWMQINVDWGYFIGKQPRIPEKLEGKLEGPCYTIPPEWLVFDWTRKAGADYISSDLSGKLTKSYAFVPKDGRSQEITDQEIVGSCYQIPPKWSKFIWYDFKGSSPSEGIFRSIDLSGRLRACCLFLLPWSNISGSKDDELIRSKILDRVRQNYLPKQTVTEIRWEWCKIIDSKINWENQRGLHLAWKRTPLPDQKESYLPNVWSFSDWNSPRKVNPMSRILSWQICNPWFHSLCIGNSIRIWLTRPTNKPYNQQDRKTSEEFQQRERQSAGLALIKSFINKIKQIFRSKSNLVLSVSKS